MFTADDLQSRLRGRPFVPLRIITSTGQSYTITHPNLVLIGREALMVGTPDITNPNLFETASRVALMHITALQDMPSASGGNRNGSAG